MRLDCELLLPLDPLSVRRARHHVVQVLREAGHADWADDAGLAVTEVVSNVVLHARTACAVSVRVEEGHARIAVRDFSPSMPVQLHFSRYATTGRGLALVARVAADFGIDALGPDGKVVWFVIDGTGAGEEPDEPGPEWDLSDLLTEEHPGDGASVALLQHVPMALWLAGLEHQTAVLRELYLVLSGSRQDAERDGAVDLAGAGAAMRLLTRGTDSAVQDAAGKPWLSRLDPLPEGHPATLPQVPAVHDVEVPLDGVDTAVFGALQEALDHGRRLALEGRLLVRPALDETVTLRDWACDQVVAQSNGVPPTPWDHTGASAAPSRTLAHTPPEWDDAPVRTSSRAVVAADDSNRLIAVSPAAAELVGVPADQLVGQRVTTIIPPRLREQHVAGFTRHLTTGQGRALGVPLNLPVLRADGREVVRRFLIEQVPAPAGRHVYVAWLDPLPDDVDG